MCYCVSDWSLCKGDVVWNWYQELLLKIVIKCVWFLSIFRVVEFYVG